MPGKVKIILGAIVLVGGLLRIVALDQWPIGIAPDELAIGLSGYSIAKTGTDYRQTGHPPLYVTGLSPRYDNRTSVLDIYANALENLVFRPSLWTIRLPGALVGTLTIFLVFLLARMLFKDNAIALTSAGVIALSPYHIFYSRFGNDAVFCIALILAGTLLFRRALRSGRALTFAASAALLALTLYGYLTYKLLTPLFIPILVVTHWQQLRQNKRGLIIWISTGLIVALPSVLVHMFHWATINAEFAFVHAQGSSTLGPIFLLLNLLSFYLPQFWAGDRTGLIVEGVLAIVGFVWLIRRRHPELLFLALWLLWFPLAAALTDTVFVIPHPLRGSSWLTLMPLLAGAGGVALVRRLRHNTVKLTAALVVFLCLATIGGARIWSHWHVGNTPTCCFAFGSRIDQPIFTYLRQQPPNEDVVVSLWGQDVWQQGLAYAFLLPVPPRLLQTDGVFEPQKFIPALDILTRVGRFRFCTLSDPGCYTPNDGKLYIVFAGELPDLPGTVLSRNHDGSVRFRAVRNIQTD